MLNKFIAQSYLQQFNIYIKIRYMKPSQRNQQQGFKPHLFLVSQIFTNELQNQLQKKYSFPAKMKRAKQHQRATKFGYKPIPKDNAYVRCSCCHLSTETEQIGLFYPTYIFHDSSRGQERSEYKLSSSVLLFFFFIKMVILFILVKLLLVDAYNIVSNILRQGICSSLNAKCYIEIWSNTSIYGNTVPESDLLIINVLNLIFILFSLGFFRIASDLQFNQYCYLDLDTQTEEKYSLVLENVSILDEDEKNDKMHLKNLENTTINLYSEVKRYFTKKIHAIYQSRNQQQGSLQEKLLFMRNSDKNYAQKSSIVPAVSLGYDLRQLAGLQQFRQRIMKQHQQSTANDNNPQQSCLVERINSAQLSICKKYANEKDLIYNLTHFVGFAVVCFQYEFQRDYIYHKSKSHPSDFKFNGRQLIISSAPPPSDIFWFNLHLSQRSRKLKGMTSYFVLFLCILFSFVIVSFIQIQKYESRTYFQIKNDDGETVYLNLKSLIYFLLTITASLVILCINFLLKSFLTVLSKWEKHKTRTMYTSSLIAKILISQFLNNAIIYWIVELLLPSNAAGNFSIVFNVGVLITLSGFLYVAINIINFKATIRAIKVWFKYRKMTDNEKIPIFQSHLNSQLQYVEFNISSRYVYYLTQLSIACFYSYIVPLSSLFMIFILTIQYWTDKFNLFYRSSMKTNLSFYLNSYLMRAFEISILILAAGNMIFSYQLTKQVSYINLAGLIVAVLHTIFFIIIPNIREANSSQKFGSYKFQSYSDCIQKSKFRQTYWRQNPATQIIQQKNQDPSNFEKSIENKSEHGAPKTFVLPSYPNLLGPSFPDKQNYNA